MSNDNVIERLWKLESSIDKMVADGVRDPENVCNYLQKIVDDPDFVSHPKETRRNTKWHRKWEKFYQKVFGLKVDLASVVIPEKKSDFGWVVIVAKGLTLNQVWAKCKEKFAVHSYFGNNLDEIVLVNDRTTETAYAKRFRNRVEADEELKNISANQLAKRNIQSITLLERLLLELWYSWKTGGQHLDIQNVTLCAGSRYSDGCIPDVYWDNDELKVYYYDPDNHDDDLRARAAV